MVEFGTCLPQFNWIPGEKTHCMVSPSSRLVSMDSGNILIIPNFDPLAWPSSAPACYIDNCLIIHICNWPQSKQHAQQRILTCMCRLLALCHVTLVGHLGSWCGLWLPWLEPGVTAIGWSSFSTSCSTVLPLGQWYHQLNCFEERATLTHLLSRQIASMHSQLHLDKFSKYNQQQKLWIKNSLVTN